ncbi:peptidyl-prolyl cis-trans isomerase D [Legionella rubrilucens]|uniref:Periplasmic chaperone PpiD n=1 Tax=Legionella rubrilucens TaxID=458 RepID=A0A0W0XVV9_9GAMM|nr:SurA N-terminal domain-containing protein [Legionella rubrilucens]KTD48607.1 peptidyl-prolyl cis-trans isomerase D [Legionella rubrilucens]
MLQKLNERIQGVVAWVVIILIAVTFTLFGVDYYMQSHQASDSEVTVNGEPISKQSFEISYRRARQQRDPSQMTTASEVALRKEVLENMIVNQITVQAAKGAGFEVSPEQANAAIVSIPQFQQDGHFSTERYQQALSGAMFTPESFQKEVRQGMLLNQQRFAFMGSAFALPEEIKRFVKLYMQTRDYNYLEIPTSLFTDHIKIDDSQVAAYYKKHQQQFIEPEKVSLDYIRLSMQDIRKNIQVTDSDIQRYYEDNQSNFLTPAQWQVAHILFAIPDDASVETEKQIKQKADEAYQALENNPMQFSQWVKTMSADKLSAANDGVLPWIVAGSTEFDKALSGLTQPGQISAPFKTAHGYELFKLIAYKPAKLKPLTDVKKEISEQLSAELAQANYAQVLEQLTDLSYQTPDSLSPAADELKLKIEQTEPFTRQGGQSDITRNKQIVNTAFSHDVLELGNNSEPVQLDNDSVIVLRVNKHIPASKKTLEQVKETIVKKLTLLQARKEAKQLGLDLLSTKSDKGKQEKIIDEKKLTWHEVEQATRDTDKADAMINDLAFSLPRVNSREGRSLVNGDYVIVQLKKINDGRYSSLDKEQQASLAQQIESSYGVMDYDLYVNSIIAKAKIERHQ